MINLAQLFEEELRLFKLEYAELFDSETVQLVPYPFHQVDRFNMALAELAQMKDYVKESLKLPRFNCQALKNVASDYEQAFDALESNYEDFQASLPL